MTGSIKNDPEPVFMNIVSLYDLLIPPGFTSNNTQKMAFDMRHEPTNSPVP
jgi:hypothetical protein